MAVLRKASVVEQAATRVASAVNRTNLTNVDQKPDLIRNRPGASADPLVVNAMNDIRFCLSSAFWCAVASRRAHLPCGRH
jgi:hypothetical protein